MTESDSVHDGCTTCERRAPLTRRRLAGMLGMSAVGVPLLAACGGGDSSTGGGAAASPTVAAGTALATTGDIEVGGGKIFSDAGVVVTQPTSGEFKGFSSTCTHQGCQVSEVKDGTIDCPCHGSQFSVTDGSVEQGPATVALPEVKLTVSGDQITVA